LYGNVAVLGGLQGLDRVKLSQPCPGKQKCHDCRENRSVTDVSPKQISMHWAGWGLIADQIMDPKVEPSPLAPPLFCHFLGVSVFLASGECDFDFFS